MSQLFQESPPVRQTAFLLTKASLCLGQYGQFANTRQTNAYLNGQKEGEVVEKWFERLKVTNVLNGRNPNRETMGTKGRTREKFEHLAKHNVICVYRSFRLSKAF